MQFCFAVQPLAGFTFFDISHTNQHACKPPQDCRRIGVAQGGAILFYCKLVVERTKRRIAADNCFRAILRMQQ